MAATASKISSTISLKLRTGVDENGRDVFKSVALRNIKINAVEQDLFDVAQEVASALKYPVEDILKQDISEIINA